MRDFKPKARKINPSPVTSAICLICSSETKRIKFCNIDTCSFCEPCMATYITTQVDMDFSGIPCNNNIRCPNHTCENKIDIQNCFKLLSSHSLRSSVNQSLFSNYLRNETSLIRCPKTGCEFAAFMHDTDIYCPNFNCDKCGEKWSNNLFIAKYSKQDLKNEISEIIIHMTCSPCPRCHVKINKTVGCDHMTCGKCKAEFCYCCLKYYDVHQKQYRECYSKKDTKCMSAFLLIVLSVLKLLLTFAFTRWLLYIICYYVFVQFLLVNIVFIAYCFVMFVMLVTAILPGNSLRFLYGFSDYSRRAFSSMIFLCFSISHIFLYINYEFFYSYTNFFLKEVIFIVIGGIIGCAIYIVFYILYLTSNYVRDTVKKVYKIFV